MSLCKDEKLNLNYYSAGSLNQWRAENDYSGSLIFNWEKSTWWQVQHCFTAGRQASPWLFPFLRRGLVCREFVQGKAGWLFLQVSRSSLPFWPLPVTGRHQKTLSFRYPHILAQPEVFLLSWPFVPVRLGTSRFDAFQQMPSYSPPGCPLVAQHQEPGQQSPSCQAPRWMLHLCPGRPTSQDERIIHSLQPIQSSASRLTLPTEVPINANYNGDFSDMGTYSYRPSNSHHILMTVSHYQYWRSLNQ